MKIELFYNEHRDRFTNLCTRSSGFSLGVSWDKSSGGSLKVKNFMDILKNSSASFQSQYFWLMYGNGSDFLPKSKKNVSGWNILNPIDPEDDK